MYANIIFIIIKLIVSKPLKPSIKLAPLITNRKQRSTNIEEKTGDLTLNMSKMEYLYIGFLWAVCIWKKKVGVS